MRDMLFRNLTCEQKKRRILASSEVMDKEGLRSTIHRHFVCVLKEINNNKELSKPEPYLYVFKEHNTREQTEKFFCRMKGSMYAVHKDRLYLILFTHSLRIIITPVPQGVIDR